MSAAGKPAPPPPFAFTLSLVQKCRLRGGGKGNKLVPGDNDAWGDLITYF